jgi:hypothetical protein
MRLMIKYPTYDQPPPPWELTMIAALYAGFLYSHIMYYNLKYQEHVMVRPLVNMYINRQYIFVLLLH